MSIRMTSKGRITVPKGVRELLSIGPGSAVRFEITPGGEVVLRPDTGGRQVMNRFAKLRGRASVRMTTDQILALMRGA